MQGLAAGAARSHQFDEKALRISLAEIAHRSYGDGATVNGSATAGEDYEATSGTLVFYEGDESNTVWVPVEYDSDDEDSETLTLWLSNLRGAQFERGIATGTILDYE